MNKAELIEYIAEATSLPKTDSKVVIDAVIQGIKDGLAKDGKVSLVGFGTFTAVTKAAREARNPRTGETVQVPERVVPKFKPAKEFKESL